MDQYHEVQLATGIPAGYICLPCLKFPLDNKEVKMLVLFIYCYLLQSLLLAGNILGFRAVYVEMGSLLSEDAIPQ